MPMARLRAWPCGLTPDAYSLVACRLVCVSVATALARVAEALILLAVYAATLCVPAAAGEPRS